MAQAIWGAGRGAKALSRAQAQLQETRMAYRTDTAICCRRFRNASSQHLWGGHGACNGGAMVGRGLCIRFRICSLWRDESARCWNIPASWKFQIRALTDTLRNCRSANDKLTNCHIKRSFLSQIAMNCARLTSIAHFQKILREPKGGRKKRPLASIIHSENHPALHAMLDDLAGIVCALETARSHLNRQRGVFRDGVGSGGHHSAAAEIRV